MVNWVNSAIGSPSIDRYNADKPLMIAYSKAFVPSSAALSKWSLGLSGTFADSDATDPTAPCSYLADQFHHLQSAPLMGYYPASYYTAWVLVRIEALTAFDSLAILGHNLGSAFAVPCRVRLEIADDSNFTTNVALLYDSALPSVTQHVANGKRVVLLRLNASGGNPDSAPELIATLATCYARLRLDARDGSPFVRPPKIGELVFGMREQFAHQPNEPFDPSHYVSSVVRFPAISGPVTQYVRNRGQRIFKLEIDEETSDAIQPVDELWRLDADFGTRRVLVIPNPKTNPGDAPYGMLQADREFPIVEVTRRTCTLMFEEAAPFAALET